MFEEGAIINELFIERLNYLIYVVLLLIGLHAMISKNNLMKKLIGMSIFQTAIILFYVSVGVKEGASIPIYLPEHDPHGSHVSLGAGNETEEASHGPVVLEAGLIKKYANPLPHVLMLTAIVVGVATLGLALALCQRIYQGYGTIEEDEILAKIEREEMRAHPSVAVKSMESSKPATSKVKKPATKSKESSTLSAKRAKSNPKTKAKTAPSTSQLKSSRSKSASSQPKTSASKSSSAMAKPATSKPKTKAKTTARPKSASTAKKTAPSKAKPRTPKK